jgi:hypothetical protein
MNPAFTRRMDGELSQQLTLQDWVAIIGLILGITGLILGVMAFWIGRIVLPLVKWIHDVQSRSVDAERKGAERYMERSDAERRFAILKEDYQRAIDLVIATNDRELSALRLLLSEYRTDFRHHENLDRQVHGDLKRDIFACFPPQNRPQAPASIQ